MPIVALNPWERLGLDLELHVPGTLRMLGENVQVSPGTPLGLGNISLRAFGDLYLYKDPGAADVCERVVRFADRHLLRSRAAASTSIPRARSTSAAT